MKNSIPIKVLLVEDNPDHILLTKRFLARSGTKFEVIAAENSIDSLGLMEKDRYDVVVCDYSMPGMSGLDILKESNKRGFNTPFIIVTSAGDEKVAVGIMKEGAYDYVVKDESLERILPNVILRAIERYNVVKEKERAEKDLQESEYRFRVLFEEAAGAILISDIETELIMQCNRFAEDLAGKPRSELINMHFSEVFPKDKAKEYAKKYLDVIKEGKNVEFEGEFERKNGSRTPVWIKSNLFEINGKKYILGLFVDITQRKVLEKVKESMSRQLLQSEKMATVGEIAAGIAHELNTPLCVILGYLELMKKRSDKYPEIKEYVDISIEEIDFCKHLIGDFLLYAQPSKNANIKDEQIDIEKTVVPLPTSLSISILPP